MGCSREFLLEESGESELLALLTWEARLFVSFLLTFVCRPFIGVDLSPLSAFTQTDCTRVPVGLLGLGETVIAGEELTFVKLPPTAL